MGGFHLSDIHFLLRRFRSHGDEIFVACGGDYDAPIPDFVEPKGPIIQPLYNYL